MSDEIDRANDYADKLNQSHVDRARRAAAEIPIGEHGECEWCGEHSQRIVDNYCARCRDELHKLR